MAPPYPGGMPPYHGWRQPPPAPRRTASFWVAIILCVLLGGSVMLNLLLGAAAVSQERESEDRVYQEVTLDGDRSQKDKVLHLQISGAIMEGEGNTPLSQRRDPVSSVRAQLKQASKDDHVKAILLEINSPGGGVTASDIIYHELDAFRKARKVPIVALFDDVAASGGYYVAMASDHIMAHETTITGSIGVISQFADVHTLMDKVGVRINTIKSQRPDGSESFKDIGSPFRVMKPAERELWQSMINQMWRRFVDVVATGREGRLTREQVEQIADGRVFTAPQALQLKLVDSLGYRHQAWKKAAQMGGAHSARLVQYSRHASVWRELLSGRSQQPSLEEVLARSLDPMTASSPRLLYLWTSP